MFIMILQCPFDKTSSQRVLNTNYEDQIYSPETLQDYNPDGLNWANFYETLFKKLSSQSILKWLFYLRKVSVKRENEPVSSFGEKAAMKLPGILLRMFAKKINLQYRKIETALTSKEDLQDVSKKLPLDSLKNETELCTHQEYCLKSIGEISYV